MKKKMISMLLSFSLLAGMAAECSLEEEEKPDSGAAEEKTAETEPTGTRVPHHRREYEIYYIAISETGGQVQNLLDIVDMYKEQVNPNFSMTIEYITDQQARNQKIRTLAASNELPDWFTCDIDSFFYELWDAGMVANVGDIYDELGIRDNFYPISLNYPSTPDGEVCGVSWQSQAEFFYYNKDVFAEAGVEKAPETMDELLEACRKIQDTGKRPLPWTGPGDCCVFWPLCPTG